MNRITPTNPAHTSRLAITSRAGNIGSEIRAGTGAGCGDTPLLLSIVHTLTHTAYRLPGLIRHRPTRSLPVAVGTK